MIIFYNANKFIISDVILFLPNMCRQWLYKKRPLYCQQVGGTCKQHPSSEHLSQYAASSPHVYGLGIVIGGQEQPGGTIPFSYQTLGQIALEVQVKWWVRKKKNRRKTLKDISSRTKHQQTDMLLPLSNVTLRCARCLSRFQSSKSRKKNMLMIRLAHP